MKNLFQKLRQYLLQLSLSKRRLWQILLVLPALWLCYKATVLYTIFFPNRSYNIMIPALQNMQTYCIGRYQIDLPKGSIVWERAESNAGGDMDANFFMEYPVTQQAFMSLVEEKWDELKNKRNQDDDPSPLTQEPQRIEVMKDAVLFTYNHHDMTLDAWPPDGKPGTKHFYDIHGYLWRDNTLYEFTKSIDKEHVIKAMRHLVVQNNTVMPTQKGFCGARSFFTGSHRDDENVHFAIRLPVKPEVSFRIQTNIEGPNDVDIMQLNDGSTRAAVVRNNQLEINGMKGTDYIDAYSEKHLEKNDWMYQSVIQARWYYHSGEPGSGIDIKLTASAITKEQPKGRIPFPESSNSSEIGQTEFLALWDGILKTLKYRPLGS